MNHLHDLMLSTLREATQPERMVTWLISQKFASLGVVLNNDQLAKIESEIDIDKLDQIIVDFSDDQVRQLQANLQATHDGLTLELTEPDIAELENRVQDKIKSLVSESITSIAISLLDEWKSTAAKLLAEQQVEHSLFQQNLYKVWARPIEFLEILVSICTEAGSGFVQHISKTTTQQATIITNVIARLHARACQVAFEVLVLLQNGFADGALARWRTLHEIAVTAMFIAEWGNDVAERYVAHTAITSYQEALTYQRHCKTLGFEPILQEDLDELKSERDRLCHLYGNHFGSENGWAAKALGISKPKFVDIEQAINLEHLRPFYKLANINVHAGAKGAFFRLGSPGSRMNYLVAGPSIFGLSDPGQNTAISMNQITTTLLLLVQPNLDRLSFLTAIQKLVAETQEAFVKAREILEARD